jgi:hypothetical protein
MPGPKHSKKPSACDRLCDCLICRSGKESECDTLATIGYFFVGSGKLDPVVFGKTQLRLILPVIKAAGLKVLSWRENVRKQGGTISLFKKASLHQVFRASNPFYILLNSSGLPCSFACEALAPLRFGHLGQHLLKQVTTNISISKALHFLQSV